MSSLFSEIGGLTAGVGAEGLAFAAGFAAAHALEPEALTIAQAAWHAAQVRRLDPNSAAEAAAEALADEGTMATEASYSGLDSTRFAYLYDLALTAPGTGELLQMLRRATINPGNFAHGLRKAKLEPMWDAALAELKQVRLSPQELALGIVRSVVADPGLLAATLDLSGGVVPAYPEWPGDALTEALAGGIDKDRLRVMVGEIGLPMSAQQAASAYFRKIIAHGDYNRAILEGDTRPEWAPFILDQARQILTAGEYAELQLRGFYDRATRLTNTAKHGMSTEDSDLLFDVLGRGPAVHAVTTGLARGGTLGGSVTGIPEVYLDAMRRSNARPEWYSIDYANRFSYNVPFWWRALATANAFGTLDPEQLLLNLGNPPEFAAAIVAHFIGTTAAAADPHVKKAQTTLFTEAHKAYVKVGVSALQVQPAFLALNIPPAAQQEILTLWDVEKTLQSDVPPPVA